MISEKLQQAFSKQINYELYSEYLYLTMRAVFKDMSLDGFANWFDVQVQEERAHAMGLINYINARGGKVEYSQIDCPKFEGKNPVEIFEEVLHHEEFVTSKINELYEVAESEKDRAAAHFLNWYIDEQVEEEDNVNNVLSTLKLIADDKYALLMYDKELAGRTFQAPNIGKE